MISENHLVLPESQKGLHSTRLLIAGGHDWIRTSLRSFLDLQPGLEVVGEARCGDELIRQVIVCKPDIVIIDQMIPELNCINIPQQIKMILPRCQILAITTREDKQYFLDTVLGGVNGYITKQSTAEELMDAINCLAQGLAFYNPTLTSWLAEDYRRVQQEVEFTRGKSLEFEIDEGGLRILSTRERQVLEGIALGFSNALLGEKLGISPKTIARHRERIMSKLNIHSSTELVKFAIRTGLVAC